MCNACVNKVNKNHTFTITGNISILKIPILEKFKEKL